MFGHPRRMRHWRTTWPSPDSCSSLGERGPWPGASLTMVVAAMDCLGTRPHFQITGISKLPTTDMKHIMHIMRQKRPGPLPFRWPPEGKGLRWTTKILRALAPEPFRKGPSAGSLSLQVDIGVACKLCGPLEDLSSGTESYPWALPGR